MPMSRRTDSENGAGAGRRVAVVGAGPAGFYASEQLLEAGLPRRPLSTCCRPPSGSSAPASRPTIRRSRRVTRMYEKTARRDGFRFFGGLELGSDITRAELLERYHAVVYATGTADDNRLGIPGEDRPGSHPATSSSPGTTATRTPTTRVRPVRRARRGDRQRQRRGRRGAHARARPRRARGHRHRRPRDRRRSPRAGVRGRPARPPRAGAGGVHEPGAARARRAHARGRRRRPRGPRARRQAPLARDRGRPHGQAQRRDPARVTRSASRTGKPPRSRCGSCARPSRSSARATTARSPASASCATASSRDDGRLRAVPTGEEEVIECGLVLRSIGYRGRPLDEVPFDERRGLIRNDGGRVCDDDGEPHPGEYCVGWIKRGPTGVIGTNKKDAADTVARIVEDAEAGGSTSPRRRRRRTADVAARARAGRRRRGTAGRRSTRTSAGSASPPGARA